MGFFGKQLSQFYSVNDVVVTSGGRTLNRLGPGECFGEIAYLDEERHARTATVTALRDTQTVLLSSREFYAAIDDVPGLSRKLLAGMAKRLREAPASPPIT